MNSANSVTKIFFFTVKGLEPATSFIIKEDQFMLQWFIWFPEFTAISEFNESSAPFRKYSIEVSGNFYVVPRYVCQIEDDLWRSDEIY